MPEASGGARAQLVLAFDMGLRRIGVACGDSLSRSASPLPGLSAGPDGPPWTAVDALIKEWQPARAVVGLPYNADDSEGAMAAHARAFAAALASRYRLPVDLVDERYSSLEAQDRLRAARQTGQRRRRVAKADVDAAAACVILERWFTKDT
jgi:putative Holliday junction resolvase